MLNIKNNLIIHINFYWFNILFKFQLQCWMIESNKIFLSNQKWPISPTARVCNYLVDRSTCVLFGFYLLTAVYFFNSLHYMKCIQLPNRWKVVTPFLIFLHQILLIYISTEKKIVKKISSLSKCTVKWKLVWWRISSEIKITFFRSFKSKGSESDSLYLCKCVCCNYVILWELFRDNFFSTFKREVLDIRLLY